MYMCVHAYIHTQVYAYPMCMLTYDLLFPFSAPLCHKKTAFCTDRS